MLVQFLQLKREGGGAGARPPKYAPVYELMKFGGLLTMDHRVCLNTLKQTLQPQQKAGEVS